MKYQMPRWTAAQVELAVAWLKNNEPAKAIAFDDVKAKVAEAKINPLAEHGGDRKTEVAMAILQAKANPISDSVRNEQNQVDIVNLIKGGNATDYTLRRLARDCPEMLDRIESGELEAFSQKIDSTQRQSGKIISHNAKTSTIVETFAVPKF